MCLSRALGLPCATAFVVLGHSPRRDPCSPSWCPSVWSVVGRWGAEVRGSGAVGAGSRGQAGAVVACGFITSVLPSQQVLRLLGFLVLLFLVGWPVLLHHGYHGHHVHLFLAAVLVSLPSLFLSASSCTQGIQLNHACLVANLSLVCGSAITAAFLRAFQYTSNSVPSLGRSLGIIAPSGHRQPLFLLVVLGLHSITPVLGIYGTLGRSGRAGASFCLLAWSVGGSWCWCRLLGARESCSACRMVLRSSWWCGRGVGRWGGSEGVGRWGVGLRLLRRDPVLPRD